MTDNVREVGICTLCREPLRVDDAINHRGELVHSRCADPVESQNSRSDQAEGANE